MMNCMIVVVSKAQDLVNRSSGYINLYIDISLLYYAHNSVNLEPDCAQGCPGKSALSRAEDIFNASW